MALIRILHVVTGMNYGGVETLLMEIYRHIDRNKIQFDFLCYNTTNGKYCDEIRNLGGRVYSVKSILHAGGALIYKNNLKRFLLAHPEYCIIHCHINGYNGYVLQVARKCGIPVRISHSHNSEYHSRGIRKYYYLNSQSKINDKATDFFACSKKAAEFLYREPKYIEKAVIYDNAIDTLKFKFNNNAREKIRDELKLQDRYVFAHVGRFVEQKNHKFLIDIFFKILEFLPNSTLLLLGDGYLQKEIKDQVSDLGINASVFFIGSKSNVDDYLSASDAFIFPSLFEGLGIVAIEAQCSGLPVFAADTVPDEAKQTDLLRFIPISNSASQWAEAIVSVVNIMHSKNVLKSRVMYAEEIRKHGYEISDKAKWLEDFYMHRYAEANNNGKQD